MNWWQRDVSTLIGIIIILAAIVLFFGGVFIYSYFSASDIQNNIVPPITDSWTTYADKEYGFSMKFPDSWKGFYITGEIWTGNAINNYKQTYSGPLIVFRNPRTTSSQQWQDVPIMVFTPDVWEMVSGNNPTIAVSAAPIGPKKIGENSKYVFATPPRWYGFTDDLGWQEAVDIVKTFKAF